MHFLFFKPAAPSVFYGVTDAICICTYVNFSCYYSLYGFVVGTRMVTTEPMVVSNPVSIGYTIYAITNGKITCCSPYSTVTSALPNMSKYSPEYIFSLSLDCYNCCSGQCSLYAPSDTTDSATPVSNSI